MWLLVRVRPCVDSGAPNAAGCETGTGDLDLITLPVSGGRKVKATFC